MKRLIITLATAVSISLMIVSCSDDATSPGMDNPPQLPTNFTPAQVDISFFQQNEMPATENHDTYNRTKATAIKGNSVLGTGGFAEIGASFIFFAQLLGVEPEIDGNSWVWTIRFSEDMFGPGFGKLESFAAASEEFIIRIVATPSSNSVGWQIFFTGQFEDGVINDALILSGETSNNSDSGTWNVHSPEHGGAVVLSYSWQKESESSLSLTTNGKDPDSGDEFTVNYEKDGTEHFMIFTEPGNSVSLYWNSSTNSGWIDENGQRSCFTNFEESAC